MLNKYLLRNAITTDSFVHVERLTMKFVTHVFQRNSRGAALADHEETPPPAACLPDLQNSSCPKEKKDKK